MKKYNRIFSILCIAFVCIKIIATILSLTGAKKLFGFSFFTVPYLLAIASSKPRLIITIALLFYLILIVITIIAVLLKKRIYFGLGGFCALHTADFVCLISSFVLTPLNYKIWGAVFSVIGATISVCCILSIKRCGVDQHKRIQENL